MDSPASSPRSLARAAELLRRWSVPARKIVRAPATAYLWLLLLLGTVLLTWQMLASWPLRHTWHFTSKPTAEVQIIRLPKALEITPWASGLVRLQAGWEEYRRFATIDALRESSEPGFVIKTRTLYLREPAESPASGMPLDLQVAVPWSVSWPMCIAWVCGLAISGWLLARLGNTSLQSALRATGHALQRQWPFFLLGGGALLGAVLLRRRGFSFPDWENDSPSYFGSVFAVMHGQAPQATPDRPFGYAVVMGRLLRWWPDLRTLVVANQFATLFAACTTGALVWVSGARLSRSATGRGLSRLAAVAAFVALAWSEALLEREWALLSEAPVAFYLAIQAAVAWVLMTRRFSRGFSLALFAGLCAAGLMSFFNRPNWGFALALLPLPWLLAGLLRHCTLREFIGWNAAGAAVLLLMAGAGFWYQAHCLFGPPAVFLNARARALVCWHVPLIRQELARRLQQEPPDAQRPLLAEMAQTLDAELAAAKVRGSGSYSSLPFDPDLLYVEGLESGPHFHALSVEEKTLLCTDLFKGGLLRTPGLYFAKVWHQLGAFWSHPYQRPNIYLPEVERFLARSARAVADREIPSPLLERYAVTIAKAQAEFAGLWPSPARLALSMKAIILFGWLNAAFATCTVGPAVLLLMAALWPRWRRAVCWRSLAPVAGLAGWAVGSAFLSALSTAATQALDVQRYLQLSIPLTLLTQFLWTMIALSLLGTLLRTFRPTGGYSFALVRNPPAPSHS